MTQVLFAVAFIASTLISLLMLYIGTLQFFDLIADMRVGPDARDFLRSPHAHSQVIAIAVTVVATLLAVAAAVFIWLSWPT